MIVNQSCNCVSMAFRVQRNVPSFALCTSIGRRTLDVRRKTQDTGTRLGTTRSSPTLPPQRQIASTVDQPETYNSPTERYPARRVLLKISGEALQGDQNFGLDPGTLLRIGTEIRESHREGIQIAVVVGGGNFFRGVNAFEGIDRATADHVGMLATTMNAICLQSILEHLEVPTRLQTALEIKQVAEPFIRRRAIRHLESGRVVIFGAGTGLPFFSTDMAAVVRAAEINAHEILKATKVQGVYTHDPVSRPDVAQFLDHLTFDRALFEHLKVMDETAMALCRDHQIPVRVFCLFEEGNITRAIRGESIGSVIKSEKNLNKNGHQRMKQMCNLGTLM